MASAGEFTERACTWPWGAKPLAGAHQVVTAFEATSVRGNGAPTGRLDFDGEPAAVSLAAEDGPRTRQRAL